MQEVPPTTLELFALMSTTAGTQERMANGSGEEGAAAGKQSDAEGDAEAPGLTSAPKTPLACPNTVQPQTERVSEAAGRGRVIAVSQVATFPIGSHVRAKAAKSKKDYNDHRGEIRELLNKKARVLMLSGPKAGHALQNYYRE